MLHSYDALINTLIGGGFAFLGTWLTNSKHLAILQEKINQLEAKVEKHNQLVERTYKLENDMNTAWKRIDEIRDSVEVLESKHEADIDKLEERVK